MNLIITLIKNLKILIRDDTRNDLNIIDFQQQKFDEIKDKNQLMEEQVVNNIINNVQIDYLQDNQHLTFPNTVSQIAMQSEANDIIKQKAFEAFNKRDEEISQELITNARNDLIKSVIDAEGEIPADVFNNITSSFEVEEEDKTERSVREHVQSTIKKINKQYLKTTKSSEKNFNFKGNCDYISDSPKLTAIISDQTSVFRRSKHLAEIKPYDR